MRYTKRSKRSFKRGKRGYKRKSKRTTKARKGLTKLIRKVALGTQETKSAYYVDVSHSDVDQDTLTILHDQPLLTTQGVKDTDIGNLECRIGDEVTPVSLNIKFMVALYPQYNFIHFRWLFIKSPYGDIPTRTTLFRGLSINKQLDEIDTERYTILKQKRFTITRHAAGGVSNANNTYTGTAEGPLLPTGQNYAGFLTQGFYPKMINISIPGSKFGKKLKYQNNSSAIKNWQYTSILFSYNCEQATSSGGIIYGSSVAVMDDYISCFKFKDA